MKYKINLGTLTNRYLGHGTFERYHFFKFNFGSYIFHRYKRMCLIIEKCFLNILNSKI